MKVQVQLKIYYIFGRPWFVLMENLQLFGSEHYSHDYLHDIISYAPFKKVGAVFPLKTEERCITCQNATDLSFLASGV